MKLIHDQASNKIHISTWDPELEETEKRIKKSKHFPEGLPKNRKHFANYFSSYPNPKKGKTSKVYLKVRFVTSEPDKLPFNLAQMGQELSESVIKTKWTYSSPKTLTHAKQFEWNASDGYSKQREQSTARLLFPRSASS
jgi:hypothetical protein